MATADCRCTQHRAVCMHIERDFPASEQIHAQTDRPAGCKASVHCRSQQHANGCAQRLPLQLYFNQQHRLIVLFRLCLYAPLSVQGGRQLQQPKWWEASTTALAITFTMPVLSFSCPRQGTSAFSVWKVSYGFIVMKSWPCAVKLVFGPHSIVSTCNAATDRATPLKQGYVDQLWPIRPGAQLHYAADSAEWEATQALRHLGRSPHMGVSHGRMTLGVRQ